MLKDCSVLLVVGAHLARWYFFTTFSDKTQEGRFSESVTAFTKQNSSQRSVVSTILLFYFREKKGREKNEINLVFSLLKGWGMEKWNDQ